MVKYLILLVLWGCGDGSDQQSAQEAVQEAVQDEKTTPDEKAKEDGTPRTVDREVISYAFDEYADLPACAEKLANALAYIRSSRTFTTCTRGAWEIVEIESETLQANEWRDPSGKKWFVTGTAVTSFSCPPGWRLPTEPESTAALAQGIILVSGSTAPIWCNVCYSGGSLPARQGACIKE